MSGRRKGFRAAEGGGRARPEGRRALTNEAGLTGIGEGGFGKQLIDEGGNGELGGSGDDEEFKGRSTAEEDGGGEIKELGAGDSLEDHFADGLTAADDQGGGESAPGGVTEHGGDVEGGHGNFGDAEAGGGGGIEVGEVTGGVDGEDGFMALLEGLPVGGFEVMVVEGGLAVAQGGADEQTGVPPDDDGHGEDREQDVEGERDTGTDPAGLFGEETEPANEDGDEDGGGEQAAGHLAAGGVADDDGGPAAVGAGAEQGERDGEEDRVDGTFGDERAEAGVIGGRGIEGGDQAGEAEGGGREGETVGEAGVTPAFDEEEDRGEADGAGGGDQRGHGDVPLESAEPPEEGGNAAEVIGESVGADGHDGEAE